MEDPATSVTSSLWASLNSWFTSTVFFVLLNLMIATIVFTSNLPDNNNNNNQQQQDQEQQEDHKKNTNHDHNNNNNQPQISRSHSILNRLKSFNLYPQQHQQDESSDTHYHQHPLEVAATQYVFPENDYQHFDSSFTASESRAEHVTHAYEFPQIHQETSTFDFDPTRQDSGRDTGSNFEPTWQEVRRNKEFDFDPTRNGADPTHKEVRRNEAYNFDPIRNGPDPTRPGIGKGTGSGFEESDEEHEFESLDEVYSKLKGGGHDRTKSDGNIRQKAPTATKMKKSASLKVGFTHPEEEVETRRPETVREKRSAAKVKVADDDDVEVDSRADDFINRFKNDLMLQRMESIMKTKGGSNRGGGN